MTSAAAARGRLGPYAIVFVVGAAAAAGVFFTSERDPLAWSMPTIALTGLLLLLIRMIDVRPERHWLQDAAGQLGLRYQPARTLPPVTPVLAAVKGPRTVQALEGDLEPGGPPVRLASVRLDRVSLAVALTDLPGREQTLEDPHGLLGRTRLAASQSADPALTDGLPVRVGHATGDDVLVVFTPVARGRPPSLPHLLEATRELRRRLNAR